MVRCRRAEVIYKRRSEIVKAYPGVIVLDPLPTLQPFVSLLPGTRPFLPAGFSHPFPKVYGCRSSRSHKSHHIFAFAIQEVDSVAASGVPASRVADQLR